MRNHVMQYAPPRPLGDMTPRRRFAVFGGPLDNNEQARNALYHPGSPLAAFLGSVAMTRVFFGASSAKEDGSRK